MKALVFGFVILCASFQAQSLTIISINTEWLWDTLEPHEGQVVGFDEGNIRPPSGREFVLETYAIAKTIEALNTDIVALVEIENKNVADTILNYLDDEWSTVFVKGRDTFTGQDVAILTRLDVIDGSASNLNDYTGSSQDGTVSKKPSKVLGVGLEDGGKKYFVIAAHLISKRGNNDKKRFAQADAIRNALHDQRDDYDHFVVLGDMNDEPGSDVLKRLRGQIGNQNTVKLGQPADTEGDDADFSYIFNNIKQLIDHILVDSDLEQGSTFETLKVPEAITDHRIVIFRSQ